MQTIVEIATKDSHGEPATKRVALLSESTMSDDEDNPSGLCLSFVISAQI